MFELAMSNGLIPIVNIPKPHKIIAATEEGKQVPFNILQEIYEAYICFLKRCEEYFLCQYIPPPDINSVGEHINLEKEIFLNKINDQNDKRIKELIFRCLLKRETCITGCDNMNDIDLLELGSYQELQGGNIVLPTGYSSILKPLCRDIPENLIIVAKPVQKIYWKRKKYNLSTINETTIKEENEDEEEEDDGNDSDRTITDDDIKTPKSIKNIKISCNNGKDLYYCDHVICTIPLGCLKQNSHEIFQPELPKYKTDSINNLLYGTVDKIFLEYERPFLNSEISEIMLLWNDEDDEHNATDPDEYLKKNWFKKIYSFSKVNDRLLLGWISGREAEYMETLDMEYIGERCTEILRKFLRDPYVPKPKRCVW